MIIYSCLNMMNLMLPIRGKYYVVFIRRLSFAYRYCSHFPMNSSCTYLAVVSTAANMTKGITKKKNMNRIRPISITAIQNASNPSTGVSQNFIKFLAIRFNSLFYSLSVLKKKIVCLRVLYEKMS